MKHFVYFNLHKKLFSLKNWKTKLVEFHSEGVILSNAVFKVSEAGRQRVLKQKRKNVHAGVLGEIDELVTAVWFNDDNWEEIEYNPYLFKSFVTIHGARPVLKADKAMLINKKVFVKGATYG